MKKIIKIETLEELIKATNENRWQDDPNPLPVLREFVIEDNIVKLPLRMRDDFIIPEVTFEEFAIAVMNNNRWNVSMGYAHKDFQDDTNK